MEYLKAKIMSISDIWALDKKLLRAAGADIKIDWASPIPNDEQLMAIIMEKQRRYDSPQEPIVITPEFVEATQKDLETKIQNLWGAELTEKPKIEIKSPEEYLPRVNEIGQMTNEAFGYGGLFSSPPGMYHSPFAGVIVAPSKFLAVVRENVSDMRTVEMTTMMGKHKVEEFLWDKAYFESTLAEEITHSLFRQLRGEWKTDFVKVMKTLGTAKEERIGLWNEVLANVTKERLTLDSFPSWGLYVASDKTMLVWTNRYARRDYLGAQALMQRTNLANVSLVDDVFPEEEKSRVHYDFFQGHPNSNQKMKAFGTALRIR